MTTALLDEKLLIIVPSMAVKLGLNESIILQQVHYWLIAAENSKDETKYRDGHWWTYNSYDDWHKNNFPFWSVRTIQRIIASLMKKGVLLRREEPDLKAKGGSRTWYSVDYHRLAALDIRRGYRQVGKGVSSECPNPSSQVGNTFTESTTETTSTEKYIADTPLAVSGGDGATTGQPASEPPQDEPPAKPKRKPRPKGDAVPAVLMNPMKDAIAVAFGWEWDGDNPMSEEEKGQIQRTAHSLCKVNLKPEQVPALFGYCKSRYENFKPPALASNVSDWRKKQRPANGTGKQTPASPANPAPHKLADPKCPICFGNGVILDRSGNQAPCTCVKAVAS